MRERERAPGPAGVGSPARSTGLPGPYSPLGPLLLTLAHPWHLLRLPQGRRSRTHRDRRPRSIPLFPSLRSPSQRPSPLDPCLSCRFPRPTPSGSPSAAARRGAVHHARSLLSLVSSSSHGTASSSYCRNSSAAPCLVHTSPGDLRHQSRLLLRRRLAMAPCLVASASPTSPRYCLRLWSPPASSIAGATLPPPPRAPTSVVLRAQQEPHATRPLRHLHCRSSPEPQQQLPSSSPCRPAGSSSCT